MRILDDLNHAARQLRTQPAWSAVLIGVLTAGIALTLAAFLLIDVVLFRPLGIQAQDRVVRVGRTDASQAWMNPSSWPMVEHFRGIDDVFEGVAVEGYPPALHVRLPDGTRELLAGRAVSGNYFDVLGVQMTLGRALHERDDTAAADPVAVVSHRYLQARMQASPDAIRQHLTIGDTSYAVVGVAPPSFRGVGLEAMDVWLPARIAMRPTSLWTDPEYQSFDAIARLAPGVTRAQASAAANASMSVVDTSDGSGERAMAAPVTRLGNFIRDADEVRGAMLLAVGALAMLLLASVNAAGLLLVRTERRRGELALRASLGASRGRLMRQQWAGAALPVGLACVFGLLGGYALAVFAIDIAGAHGVLGVSREDLPPLARCLPVLGAVLAVCSLLCALPAMLRVGGARLSAEVAGGFGSGARSGRRWHAGRALVMVQFALTVAVAGGGALFVQRFVEQWFAPLGVTNEHALVMGLDLGEEVTPDAANAAYRTLLDEVQRSGLVQTTAVAGMVPIAMNSMTTAPSLPNADADFRNSGFYNPVSAGFFDALGIPLLDGRVFDTRDNADAAAVAIVSAATAERLWPGESALGKILRFGEAPPVPTTVVGVVADVRYRADANARPIYYVPVEQRFFGGAYGLIATPASPANAAATRAMLRDVAQRFDTTRAPGAIDSIAERVQGALAGPRFVASVATAFGALAVLLAATGIYGAFAFLVTARRRELGIRLAIGSTPRALFRLVVGEAGVVIAGGVVLGMIGGVGLAMLAHTYAVGLPDVGIATLGAVIAAIGVAGLAAVVPSARNAAAIDPQACLRSE